MAEFCEVMRQAKRMCDDPNGVDVRKGFATLIDDSEDFVRAFEKLVMDWAQKNPEPRYPSWKEWQEANFPAAVLDVCPARFGPYPFGDCDRCCDYCVELPIPADIAEKLGVKPIGGGAG